jgi:formylglycine-generating enzyme required for sulfatase activity
VTLRALAFDVVTLVADGRETERRRGSAEQVVEDLGDGVILEMVRIPGGTFVMGAPEGEAGSGDEERPQHRVTVPLFYLSKYAVTIAHWAAVTGALPDGMKILDETFTASRRQPVVRVSYNEAEAFCTRLSQTVGRDYRLPTEAEWEYACRAGAAAPFAFGETVTPQVANYAGAPLGTAPAKAKNWAATMPVGSLGAANGFGLFDMHGNVWEWCQDLWNGDYVGAPIDGSAWRSGADRRTRVLRGGSWSSSPSFCRSAARSFSGDPTVRSRQIGFRLAMTASAG